jgi:hypothetical protein
MFICQTSLKFVHKIDPQLKFEIYILKENIIYYPYVDLNWRILSFGEEKKKFDHSSLGNIYGK